MMFANFRHFKKLTGTVVVSFMAALTQGETAQPVILELGQAYQHVLNVNLRLKASAAKICATEGEREQAAAWPNPILEVSLSDIGRGPGHHNDNDNNNEIFVWVAQVIETGGKRSARMRVAEANQCVTDWNYEIQKKELFAQLMHAFIDMAFAQERLSLATRQETIAEQIASSVKDKVSSGKSSSIEEKKADIALKTTKVSLGKQRATLKKAKQELAALWNHCPPVFDSVSYPLHDLKAPPCLDILTGTLSNHPALAKAMAETTRASEVLTLERSQRIPDVALQVGVSTEQFIQQPALAVGFEMSIPLFNTNQGNINRASYEQLEALYDQMDLESTLEVELAATYEEWIGAYDQAIALRDSVLPTAEETMKLAQEGYSEGLFNYLHLLDANSTLITVREQYLEAIAEYHHKRAEVFRLTAACSYDAF